MKEVRMAKEGRLYNTQGELLYDMAKTDCVIHDLEREAFKEMLSKYSWASEIKWPFDYEESNNTSLEEAYNKAINACHSNGPSVEHENFIDAMTFLADSSN